MANMLAVGVFSFKCAWKSARIRNYRNTIGGMLEVKQEFSYGRDLDVRSRINCMHSSHNERKGDGNFASEVELSTGKKSTSVSL